MTDSFNLLRNVFVFMGICITALSACQKSIENDDITESPVETVSILAGDDGALNVSLSDAVLTIPITFTPEDAKVTDITAKSSNPAVATAEVKLLTVTKAPSYNAELTITLLSEGETDISVTVHGKTDVLHLVVGKGDAQLVFAITGETTGISSEKVHCGMSMVNSDKLPAFNSYVMGGVCYSEENTLPVVPSGEETADGHGCKMALAVTFKTGQTPVDGVYEEIPVPDLKPSTLYYYRAFVWIDESDTVFYGEVKTFRTADLPKIAAGEVDLGLSVNWWGCNVGATVPEGFGDYYAWGETETQTDYSLKSYKWRYTKYHTTQSEEGYVTSAIVIDNKTILDAEDDIATLTLGSEWRMPTVEEIRELKDLNPVLYTLNGVEGLLFTGKNGNSMFIPFNGFKKESRDIGQGKYVMLWSCKASVDDALRAGAYETESQWGGVLNTYAYRFVGMGVRGVRAPRPKDGPALKYTDFSATDITTNSATISLTVDLDDAEISYEGVGLQVSSDPAFKTLTADKNFGSTGGALRMELTGLAPACQYYVRAYVGTTTNGLYLGTVFTFSTETDVVDPYVDMGTGVLWASWDLGAEIPEEIGQFYAWGETEPRNMDDFTPESYTWYSTFVNGRYKYSKYNSSDKMTVLLEADDAVTAKLGSGYRTPTAKEWGELLANCSKEAGTRNGVSGYILTSKINGRTLFFPYKYYMTATIRTSLPNDLTYYDNYYSPSLSQNIPESWTADTCVEYMAVQSRYRGTTVRPVADKE